MNEKLKRLLAEAQTKSAARDEILNKDDFTQEELMTAEKLNGELVDLKSQIETLRKTANGRSELDSFFNDPQLPAIKGGASTVGSQSKGAGYTEFEYDEKTQTMHAKSVGEGLLSKDQLNLVHSKGYKDAFLSFVAHKGDIGGTADYKTLLEGTDGSGGFLVPEEMLNRLIQKTAAPMRVNSKVTQMTTGRDSLTVPRVIYTTDDIYTTGIRATLTGEVPASSTTHRVTDPVFGNFKIDIGTWMLSLPLTNDLIEDSMIDILGYAGGKFGETIDLLYDNQILNGTGVGANPSGIMRNPGGTDEVNYTLSGTSGHIDADQIRKIPFDVPEQYINENTCWVFNRGVTGKYVSVMKDSQNRYLFLDGQTFPGLVGRTPDSLAGYPIAYSAFMPDEGTNTNYPLLFGDLTGYMKVNRVGYSVRMLNELYAETNQVVMLGRLRWGGKVVEPFKMRIGKSHSS